LEDLDISINPENRNPEREADAKFQYVDLSSVGFNDIDGVKVILGSQAPSRARRVIREGDVILSTVRPYLGGHAVVAESLENQICSTGFAVLRCGSDINPKFLYYMLISPQVVQQFHSMMRGAHYPALKDDHVRDIRIPALERTEQDVLVERLDELLEKMNAAETQIEAFAQRLTGETRLSMSALLADVYGSGSE
jgi:type I restriction enzyme S subunit